MMEFELLRSFVAVAECGGFHRAAAFRFARGSAHCASRKRIGLAARVHEPQSYGWRLAPASEVGGMALRRLSWPCLLGICPVGELAPAELSAVQYGGA
jgi:hypothetical protein